MTAESVIKGIDAEEFKKQRQCLMDLMESDLPDEQLDLIEGLINLTDHIADVAHDEFGMDTLLTDDQKAGA